MFWKRKSAGCATCWRLTHSAKYDRRSLVMNYERCVGVYRCAECRTFWEIGRDGAVPITNALAVELANGAPLPS